MAFSILIFLLITQGLLIDPNPATRANTIDADGATAQQDSLKNSGEQDIRAALCDLDQRAYVLAQQRLERLLKSDPKNVNAQKLLLASLAEQIKPGDKSPENIALIRKSILAYQEALNNPLFNAEEKGRIDRFLVSLYGRISREEQRKELQKRAADVTRTAKDRSSAYTILASESWSCSFSITDRPAVKVPILAGNKATIVYRKPREQKDFDSAQACVKRGLEEVASALKLDPANDSAWSYKGNLLLEASKLAEMDGNVTQKVLYKKQSDEALKNAMDLNAQRQAESEKEWAKKEQERKNDESFTPEQAASASRELVEYRRENSLAEAIKTMFIPEDTQLTTLVAPVPIPEEESESAAATNSRPATKGCFREVDGPAQVQEKRNWKPFAPAGADIVVDLPDNVCQGSGGYLAASEGVMYSINAIPRPSIALDPTAVDGALNILARTFAGFRSGLWLSSGMSNSFELKPLRKETVDGQPRKTYAYARVSCKERIESVLVIQAAKAHYYTIDISGANESDPRVQRFLGSLKVQ